MTKILGADKAAWDAFAKLGLTESLLPAVADPDNPIHEGTTSLKQGGLGKIPSRLDGAGLAHGMKWRTHSTTQREIDKWVADGRYNLCGRTGVGKKGYIGFDLDIEDQQRAAEIQAFIERILDLFLPTRIRNNSGRRLLIVRVLGTAKIMKQFINTNYGMIEIQADGFQCVLAGRHPSGAYLEWVGGYPTEIPEITMEEFWHLIKRLRDDYGIPGGPEVGRGGTLAGNRRPEDIEDDILHLIDDSGWVLSVDSQGKRLITCPWEAGHTGGNAGDGSTVYLPAGLGGIHQGAFKCSHAHCAQRTEEGEWLEALGIHDEVEKLRTEAVLSEFPLMSKSDEASVPGGPGGSLRRLRRNTKTGDVKPTSEHLDIALRMSEVLGAEFRYDTFHQVVQVRWRGEDWRALQDVDATRVRIVLTSPTFKFLEPADGKVSAAIAHVAGDSPVDPLRAWVLGLKWDGVPRVETFLEDFAFVKDPEIARAVSLYLWTALAGRALSVRGIKADMVPVLYGPQGLRKSTLVQALAPFPEWSGSLGISKTDEMVRMIFGTVVMELEELRGLRTSDSEHIKAFISQAVDKHRKLYEQTTVQIPRRCLFIGTTNNKTLLSDTTGNRRWLPVVCEPEPGEQIDTDAIVRIRGQLWAEAAVRYLVNGIERQDAERLNPAMVLEFDANQEHPLVERYFEWVDVPWFEDEDEASTGVERTTNLDRLRTQGMTTHELWDALVPDAPWVKSSREVGQLRLFLGNPTLCNLEYHKDVRQGNSRCARWFAK